MSTETDNDTHRRATQTKRGIIKKARGKKKHRKLELIPSRSICSVDLGYGR